MFAALAFVMSAGERPSQHDLVQCLAYLAQAPEYRSLSDDDLRTNNGFLHAAKNVYCSDEVLPFWDLAHRRARAKMKLPRGGPTSIEQQELAEQEIQFLIADAWQEARATRNQPEPLSRERLSKFIMVWVLDEHNSAVLGSAAEESVSCVVAAMKKDGTFRAEDVTAGRETPAVRKVVSDCGYDRAQQTVARAITARFPDADAAFARAIANDLMGQFTFWAMLGE